MTMREIPNDRWTEDLDAFSREHAGLIVRLLITGGDSRSRTEVRNLPLQGVSVDSTRGASIGIMIGRKPGDHVTHEISNAQTVEIERSDKGAARALRVRGADGSTAILEIAAE